MSKFVPEYNFLMRQPIAMQQEIERIIWYEHITRRVIELDRGGMKHSFEAFFFFGAEIAHRGTVSAMEKDARLDIRRALKEILDTNERILVTRQMLADRISVVPFHELDRLEAIYRLWIEEVLEPFAADILEQRQVMNDVLHDRRGVFKEFFSSLLRLQVRELVLVEDAERRALYNTHVDAHYDRWNVFLQNRERIDRRAIGQVEANAMTKLLARYSRLLMMPFRRAEYRVEHTERMQMAFEMLIAGEAIIRNKIRSNGLGVLVKKWTAINEYGKGDTERYQQIVERERKFHIAQKAAEERAAARRLEQQERRRVARMKQEFELKHQELRNGETQGRFRILEDERKVRIVALMQLSFEVSKIGGRVSSIIVPRLKHQQDEIAAANLTHLLAGRQNDPPQKSSSRHAIPAGSLQSAAEKWQQQEAPNSIHPAMVNSRDATALPDRQYQQQLHPQTVAPQEAAAATSQVLVLQSHEGHQPQEEKVTDIFTQATAEEHPNEPSRLHPKPAQDDRTATQVVELKPHSECSHGQPTTNGTRSSLGDPQTYPTSDNAVHLAPAHNNVADRNARTVEVGSTTTKSSTIITVTSKQATDVAKASVGAGQRATAPQNVLISDILLESFAMVRAHVEAEEELQWDQLRARMLLPEEDDDGDTTEDGGIEELAGYDTDDGDTTRDLSVEAEIDILLEDEVCLRQDISHQSAKQFRQMCKERAADYASLFLSFQQYELISNASQNERRAVESAEAGEAARITEWHHSDLLVALDKECIRILNAESFAWLSHFTFLAQSCSLVADAMNQRDDVANDELLDFKVLAHRWIAANGRMWSSACDVVVSEETFRRARLERDELSRAKRINLNRQTVGIVLVLHAEEGLSRLSVILSEQHHRATVMRLLESAMRRCLADSEDVRFALLQQALDVELGESAARQDLVEAEVVTRLDLSSPATGKGKDWRAGRQYGAHPYKSDEGYGRHGWMDDDDAGSPTTMSGESSAARRMMVLIAEMRSFSLPAEEESAREDLCDSEEEEWLVLLEKIYEQRRSFKGGSAAAALASPIKVGKLLAALARSLELRMLEERREWSDKESKERVLLEKMLAAGFDEQVHRRAVSESEEQQRAQLIRKRRPVGRSAATEGRSLARSDVAPNQRLAGRSEASLGASGKSRVD